MLSGKTFSAIVRKTDQGKLRVPNEVDISLVDHHYASVMSQVCERRAAGRIVGIRLYH